MQQDRPLPELTAPPLRPEELALVDLNPRSTVAG
jgi:hypothetical protein